MTLLKKYNPKQGHEQKRYRAYEQNQNSGQVHKLAIQTEIISCMYRHIETFSAEFIQELLLKTKAIFNKD